ncbi:MAG TPA: prolyl oligopeptidase family serine peptidase [Enhygromyxa sp.]|nr:prolyl oligopeptidase family serine peptidase [Enhygromyxa sp.]
MRDSWVPRLPGQLCLVAVLCVGAVCYEPPPPQPDPESPPPRELTPEDVRGLETTPEFIEPELRYREPAPEIVAVVDAAPTPAVSLAPDGSTLLLADYPSHPSIDVVAEPFLGLAGERITPRTNQHKRSSFYERLRLVDVGSGISREVTGVPANPRLSHPDWSPDGRKLAFTHAADDHVQLWVVDVATASARKLIELPVNAALDDGLLWVSGSERLLVRTIVPERGPAPVASPVAAGPLVEETSGRAATNRTYQDLLQSPLDDALFTHYFTSELVLVSLDGETTKLGEGPRSRGVFAQLDASPDGEWLLVERLLEPYSRVVPWYRFASTVELWSLRDPEAPPIVLLKRPVAEEVPIEGVRTGPRDFEWQPLEPATLVWAEALDRGDPRVEAEQRDRVVRLSGPFGGKTSEDGVELTRTEHRFSGIDWLDQPGRYLITQYDRDRRWKTTHLRELADPGPGRVLFDRSIHDDYRDPGRPVRRNLTDDSWVVRTTGEGDSLAIFLAGDGAYEGGERPFLDRLALQEGATPERLFQSPRDSWAAFVGFAGDTGTLVIRREAPHDPPDWFRESITAGEPFPLTALPHPHPTLDGAHKQLLNYKRRDGVPVSATLHLPPGYDPTTDGRLPVLIWAYPREYVDADTAGQVRAAPTRFTRIGGTSANVLLLEGYAVMFAAMPVVGDPETVNDTLIEQLVMSAEAAVDTVVEIGVADRERIAISGHSYGAFMVANLLAHTELFKAGVARSGAYNRSLTPFGFQSERRNLWEATDAYVRVSPLFTAQQIDEPILLIHGELDDNPGTFPLQTKRLFHALQGLGGTARMVILPHESHGYEARESVLHTNYETSAWLAKHLIKPD